MLFDNSLSIINRTGAYHIAKDLCHAFVPEQARVRHWRLGRHAPEGLARKIAARLMMMEINWLGDSGHFLVGDDVGRGSFRLFLDPLYVLRSQLSQDDIVLCHDVGPLTHPRLYDARTVENYRLAYDKIARHAPGMVFVSDWSRDNFVAIFGARFRFLKTIPLYVRTGLFTGPTEPVAEVDCPFLLTVGALETRKNQLAALDAFREGGFHEKGYRYILCGSRGAGHQEIAERVASTPGATILGYVSDPQLRWLYTNAEAFVLPSLLEGFGMPALEAAHMGLLPIVSEDSALVEAVGGICLQVPPDDPSVIADAIEQALLRSDAEKAKTAEQLRRLASAMSKERFLAEWRNLLLSHQNCLAALSRTG